MAFPPPDPRVKHRCPLEIKMFCCVNEKPPRVCQAWNDFRLHTSVVVAVVVSIWRRVPTGLCQSSNQATKLAICFCYMRQRKDPFVVALCPRRYQASSSTRTLYFLITWQKREALKLLLQVGDIACGVSAF